MYFCFNVRSVVQGCSPSGVFHCQYCVFNHRLDITSNTTFATTTSTNLTFLYDNARYEKPWRQAQGKCGRHLVHLSGRKCCELRRKHSVLQRECVCAKCEGRSRTSLRNSLLANLFRTSWKLLLVLCNGWSGVRPKGSPVIMT